MKSLRRSLVNKDSNTSSGNVRISTPLSLPAVGKPTSAMMPPTKVIKAVESYRSQAPQELSFNKGDFFHVVRDVDRGTFQYYEANNPMTGARGLVPRDLFEEFGKADTARIASVSAGPRNMLNTTNVQPPPGGPGVSPIKIGQPSPASPSAPGKQTYYAIVMHDFSAERPDELDARQGEAITVVAQSNREWFVGKPIGKLGRPGLIPISFVELRDPTSGQPVTDILALLDRGEIPLVEEWKKAMNQYKAASIPLGVIDDPAYGGVPNSPFQRQPDRNSAVGFGSPGGSQDFSHPGPLPQQPPSSQQPMNVQDPQPQDQPQYALLPEGILYSADVGSFHFENGEYWFRINAVFQPEDLNGGPPPNALQLVLFRVYNDFYDFQITLLETFPIEAGREPPPENPSAEPERILPYMPGPVASVDAVVTAERCTELDEYVRNLSQLREVGSEHILRHELVRSFFCPRDGDAEQEIEPVLFQNNGYAQEDDQRYADQMRGLSVSDQRDDRYYNDNGYQQQEQGYGGQGRSSQYERGHERGPSRSNGARSRNDSGPTAPSQRSSGGPDGGWDEYGPQHQSQNSYSGANGVRPGSRMSGGPTSNAPAISASNPNSAYIKIKIFDRNTDDLIAIRVPPRVTHQQLMDKVRERLGKDVTVLRYRNSMTGRYDDLVESDLKHWLESADKLVLYAD